MYSSGQQWNIYIIEPYLNIILKKVFKIVRAVVLIVNCFICDENAI